MEVSLKVKKPKGGTKTYKVSKPEVVVGRGKDCDMQILSTEVSRQHCRISVGEDQVSVQDLGSANGTNVNGIPIQANKEIPLVPDSLIEIGPLKIRVMFERPEDIFNASSTMPATQDGTVMGEDSSDERATADEIPVLPIEEPEPVVTSDPVDVETLEEIDPVTPTRTGPGVEDLLSQTLELDSIEELEDGVEFDMAAVPEELQADDSDDLEELEPADEVAADAPAAEQKSGGLKGLFGMLGRGKKDSEPEAVEEPPPAAPAEVAPVVAPPAPVAEAPVAAAAEEEVDELEGIDESELDELLEELDEDEIEALLAEEDVADDAPAANPAPQPPADPGLNDFLNQMGSQ